MKFIPFNKPYLTGKETHYIYQAVNSGKLSGNGDFTSRCHDFFEKTYGFRKCLLTTSCTDALEMCALLLEIGPGDEVIMPSYTFVSTANSFMLRGAKIVFTDSYPNHPNLDPDQLENLITPKTKAIVVVHYAGMSCNMDKIRDIADRHDLFVIEDAAQAIDSYYQDKPLGSIGDLATFSFHETKNIISGEGGMLVINNPRFFEKSEIIWEKGTNRSSFFRGEVDKYSWVALGSSFLPSEVIAAFLFAQLENLQMIQSRRKLLWQRYYTGLEGLHDNLELPLIPNDTSTNGHLFYIVSKAARERDELLRYLNNRKVNAVFHYLSLHRSDYFKNKHDGRILPNADRFSESLLRLPMFFELTIEEVDYIVELINSFYLNK